VEVIATKNSVLPETGYNKRGSFPPFYHTDGLIMEIEAKLDFEKVLDRLEQGLLIFNHSGQLIYENQAAHTLLGQDLNAIRNNGWGAAAVLFNSRQINPDCYLGAVREKALEMRSPIRFQIFRSGEVVPCWLVTFDDAEGKTNTMITLDVPDWSAMTQLVGRFHDEMKESVIATQGHIDLIHQSIKNALDSDDQSLGRRVSGFSRLISIHMHRTNRFLEMMERMEDIRLGKIKEQIGKRRQKIDLTNFLEDFVEELDEIRLTDPETEDFDHHARLKVAIKEKPMLMASSPHLTRILRDVLRNAIMYSMVGTPITMTVHPLGQRIQIDIVDEGYVIRKRERGRVFTPFQRARQPQIIAEFGYGLSLYLCRYEVEAMNGRMWYESEEGVGTTLSMMLPVWEAASSSSSSTTTP
jgi:signal transduction histidine kinase